MKRLAAITVLCGFGSIASAWSLFASSAELTNAAMLASERVAETEALAPPGFCISNFSKNDCEGVVEPGTYEVTGCDSSGQDCRSIRVTKAVYKTELKSSGLACGLQCESRCDEFPDGTLVLKFNYVLRADSCCPFRGSWQGKWEYVTVDGKIFTGVAHGTIGVGTNRKSDCLATNDDCERCYDVIKTDDQWLVGIEGSFQGTAVNSTSPYADELNFTCDGTWIEKATANRPFGEPFRVVNRFDGDFVDYCP